MIEKFFKNPDLCIQHIAIIRKNIQQCSLISRDFDRHSCVDYISGQDGSWVKLQGGPKDIGECASIQFFYIPIKDYKNTNTYYSKCLNNKDFRNFNFSIYLPNSFGDTTGRFLWRDFKVVGWQTKTGYGDLYMYGVNSLAYKNFQMLKENKLNIGDSVVKFDGYQDNDFKVTIEKISKENVKNFEIFTIKTSNSWLYKIVMVDKNTLLISVSSAGEERFSFGMIESILDTKEPIFK